MQRGEVALVMRVKNNAPMFFFQYLGRHRFCFQGGLPESGLYKPEQRQTGMWLLLSSLLM